MTVDPQLLALLRDETRPLHPLTRRPGRRQKRRPVAEPTRWDRVLVDHPRRWSHERHPKRRQQRRWTEDGPKRARIAHGNRSFGENLGPLKHFLTASEGRAWDEVRAELTRRLTAGNVVHDHVLVHLEGYVAEHVEMRGGVPWQLDGWRIRPVFRYGRSGWYVHPDSGLLTRCPTRRRSDRHR